MIQCGTQLPVPERLLEWSTRWEKEYSGLNAEYYLAFCQKIVKMHVNYIYSNALTMAAYGDCVPDGLKRMYSHFFVLKIED